MVTTTQIALMKKNVAIFCLTDANFPKIMEYKLSDSKNEDIDLL